MIDDMNDFESDYALTDTVPRLITADLVSGTCYHDNSSYDFNRQFFAHLALQEQAQAGYVANNSTEKGCLASSSTEKKAFRDKTRVWHS